MKQFKEPDRKAPRVRKTSLNLLTREFYDEFRKKYPECKSLTNVELRRYIKSITSELTDVITNTRDGIELPTGLGYIFIGCCVKDVKKHKTDMFTSKQLGVIVGLRNLDSDEHLAKIFYTNYEAKYKFKHNVTWGFKGCRILKNKTSKAFRENWNKFRVVENYVKIGSLFRANSARKMMKDKSDFLIKDYNDLEI